MKLSAWTKNHLLIKLDQWFEEDLPIYGHPKDPYKRIDILPSTRTVTAKVDGVTVAESRNSQFLYETMLRARYYMPKTAVSLCARHKDVILIEEAHVILGSLGVSDWKRDHLDVPIQGSGELWATRRLDEERVLMMD